MPKSKFQALIFSIKEANKQLASKEISIHEAEIIFDKLLTEYNEIIKSPESDDFNNFLDRILK